MSSASRRGFTLLELLVVISLIAILAAVVTPMVFRNIGDAKQAAARAQIGILELALDAYRLDNDYYPSSAQGLSALTTRPTGAPAARNWRGPYLKRGIPLDPWGRADHYLSPGAGAGVDYDLASFGRDGTVGGQGDDADITNAPASSR